MWGMGVRAVNVLSIYLRCNAMDEREGLRIPGWMSQMWERCLGLEIAVVDSVCV